MDAKKCLETRRSIRKFLKKDVSWEILAEILDAINYGPIAGNVQSTRAVIIRKPDMKKLVCQTCEDQPWMEKVPVFILLCSETEQLKMLYKTRGEFLYAVQNTAIAAQNMLLKAHTLGLGTCWIGDFDEKKIRTFFQIAETARPQLILALGYPGETPEGFPKEPLENILAFEQYGKRVREEGAKQQPLEQTLNRAIERVKAGLERIKQ